MADATYVVMLVCSAGGLEAVGTVLGGLAEDLPAAVVVLRHITPSEPSALAEILGKRSRWPVEVARDGACLLPGVVLVAPPGHHTLVTPTGTVSLIRSGPYPPSRPSADLLLVSAAMAVGPAAIAVILSGAGRDGASGAAAIQKQGGIVLATNEGTSAYFSMPRAAIAQSDTVTTVLELPDVASHITELVRGPKVSR